MDERQDQNIDDIVDRQRIEALALLLSAIQSLFRLDLEQGSESFTSAVRFLKLSGDLDDITDMFPDLKSLGIDMKQGVKQITRLAHLDSLMGDAYHNTFDMLFTELDKNTDVNTQRSVETFSENNKG